MRANGASYRKRTAKGSMSKRTALIAELQAHANQSDAVFAQQFFKTGPGEYGEGDRFLGLRVPQTRAIAKKYQHDLTVNDFDAMLNNKWHEVRLAALVSMVNTYKKSSTQKEYYELYMRHIGQGINNWDLVDMSCPNIIGAYLSDSDRAPLYELAKGGLWHKRVSIISTFYFLRNEQNPIDTYQLAELLVAEKHDLLHKAVGWALREMGKVDSQLLRQFLNTYAATMPRTMLRYAIEKLSDTERQHYMNIAK